MPRLSTPLGCTIPMAFTTVGFFLPNTQEAIDKGYIPMSNRPPPPKLGSYSLSVSSGISQMNSPWKWCTVPILPASISFLTLQMYVISVPQHCASAHCVHHNRMCYCGVHNCSSMQCNIHIGYRQLQLWYKENASKQINKRLLSGVPTAAYTRGPFAWQCACNNGYCVRVR